MTITIYKELRELLAGIERERTEKEKKVLEWNRYHNVKGQWGQKGLKKGSATPGKEGPKDYRVNQDQISGKGKTKKINPKQKCGRAAREAGGNVRCYDGKVFRPTKK